MEGAILSALNSQNTRINPGAQNKTPSGLQSPFGQQFTENEFPRPDILGNLGIQDFKHSKQRTRIYESCSSDQICDSNMNFLKKNTKGYSLALPLISAFTSVLDGTAGLGTPFVQDQLWKWSQMCSALPGCGRSKTLSSSRAGLVILVLAVPRAVSTILESDINKCILCL